MTESIRFDNVPGVGHELDCLYAWVAAEEGTGEGIIAVSSDDVHLPMVCATPDAALRLLPLAQQAATATGRTVRLLRFTQRTEVQALRP
jgi:hypothetical protein